MSTKRTLKHELFHYYFHLTAGYHLSPESTSTFAPTPKTPVAVLLPADPVDAPPSFIVAAEALEVEGEATGSHFPKGAASALATSVTDCDGGGPGGGSADSPLASSI